MALRRESMGGVLRTIVEGEPGIFPDPVARAMRKIGGLFDRKRPPAPDQPADPGTDRPDTGRPGADQPATGTRAADRSEDDRSEDDRGEGESTSEGR